MTIEQFVEETKRLQLLVGETCVQARAGYANTLMLDFGMLHPPDEKGYQEPEKCIIVECPWRLETSKAVIVGSGDPDESLESRLTVLVGKRLELAKTFKPSYMTHLQFTDGVFLWVFPDDSRNYDPERAEYFVRWFVTGRAIPG